MNTMTQKAIVSFGGPFPYDRSFRGQMFVMGDLIREAVSRKMTSTVITKCHERRSQILSCIEPQMASICRKAFSSELLFRYKEEFESARKEDKRRRKSCQNPLEAWNQFYGIDIIRRLLEENKEVHYLMHYYNSRFQDADFFSETVKSAGLCRQIKGYYIIHICPDQLIDNNVNGKWVISEHTKGTVENLMKAIRNECFDKFIAVSEATKTMWLELIEKFKFNVWDAYEKIKAVPNGIDTNLYHDVTLVENRKEIDAEREALGFGKNVRKIALVMTRPSISKGIDRIRDILRECNSSTDPSIKRIGFLVALPETEGTAEFVNFMREMDNLVKEKRIRATIDISKVLRGREDLITDFKSMQRFIPSSYENEGFYTPPIKYPLTYVSDVLLHVPHAEAFGLVLAEALLSGCSVITTNVGGIPEVIRNAPDRAIGLREDRFDIGEVLMYLQELGRHPASNERLVQQFSLKNQFDNIMGDGDG